MEYHVYPVPIPTQTLSTHQQLYVLEMDAHAVLDTCECEPPIDLATTRKRLQYTLYIHNEAQTTFEGALTHKDSHFLVIFPYSGALPVCFIKYTLAVETDDEFQNVWKDHAFVEQPVASNVTLAIARPELYGEEDGEEEEDSGEEDGDDHIGAEEDEEGDDEEEEENDGEEENEEEEDDGEEENEEEEGDGEEENEEEEKEEDKTGGEEANIDPADAREDHADMPVASTVETEGALATTSVDGAFKAQVEQRAYPMDVIGTSPAPPLAPRCRVTVTAEQVLRSV